MISFLTMSCSNCDPQKKLSTSLLLRMTADESAALDKVAAGSESRQAWIRQTIVKQAKRKKTQQ